MKGVCLKIPLKASLGKYPMEAFAVLSGNKTLYGGKCYEKKYFIIFQLVTSF